MAEAVDFLRVGSTLQGGELKIAQVSTTAARVEEAGRMFIKFKMLHVMVVACQIQIDVVFPEQRVPIANQAGVVAVRAVGIYGMMRHRHQVGCGSWTRELGLKPSKLLAVLLCSKGKVAPTEYLVIVEWNIAVERKKGTCAQVWSI